MSNDSPSDRAPSLNNTRAYHHYVDGYQMARGMKILGRIIQTQGVIVGLIIGVGASLGIMAGALGDFPRVDFLVTIFAGIAAWFSLYSVGQVFGVLGHILGACLDSAMHSSPFLSDAERDEIMHG